MPGGTRRIGYDGTLPGAHVKPLGSTLSNGTRASILHLLASSPDTLYSMQVQELASILEMSPRMVIYHLEKLKASGLVDVKKARKYGLKERRSIWGLDARKAGQVCEWCDSLGRFEQLRAPAFDVRPGLRRARADTAYE